MRTEVGWKASFEPHRPQSRTADHPHRGPFASSGNGGPCCASRSIANGGVNCFWRPRSRTRSETRFRPALRFEMGSLGGSDLGGPYHFMDDTLALHRCCAGAALAVHWHCTALHRHTSRALQVCCPGLALVLHWYCSCTAHWRFSSAAWVEPPRPPASWERDGKMPPNQRRKNGESKTTNSRTRKSLLRTPT